MLEMMSIPMVCNAYFTLIFAGIVGIPLLIVRSHLEEKILIHNFGQEYKKYRNKTGFLLPSLKG
jgi:protein-S-isoprenylcysteine O-methyltransferase Ste14